MGQNVGAGVGNGVVGEGVGDVGDGVDWRGVAAGVGQLALRQAAALGRAALRLALGGWR